MKLFNLQLFGGGGGSSWGRGFKDITHPGQRQAGHREYYNTKTNQRGRYDPARGKDPQHYHVYNPNSKNGNEDMYLDKNGNPASRHSKDAALTKEEFEKLMRKTN